MTLVVGCSSFGFTVRMRATDYFEQEIQADLAIAVSRGQVRAIEELVKRGADVNYRGKEGATPLLWGLAKESITGVGTLLELGADPNQDSEAGSPLELASIMEDSRFLALLLSHDGDANKAVGTHGRTVLFEAAIHRRIDNINLLEQNGADVNHLTESGQSVMSYAIYADSYEAAQTLLNLGADPFLKAKSNTSAYDALQKYGGLGLDKRSEQYRQYEELRDEVFSMRPIPH